MSEWDKFLDFGEDFGDDFGDEIKNEDSKVKDEKKDKVNIETLVLSGGSTRGITILGSLLYFYSNKHLENVINFVGTSIGSVICYLLILGYTPINILTYLCSTNLIEDDHINLLGVNNGEGLYDWNEVMSSHIKRLTLDKIGIIPTLDDLYKLTHMSLTCVTYNKSKMRVEYLSYKTHPDLSCIDALRMSSNLPLIFSKFCYKECEYIDGGIADNFAIEYADKNFPPEAENFISEEGTSILGIEVREKENKSSSNVKFNILRELYSIISIPLHEIRKIHKQNCSDRVKIIELESSMSLISFKLNVELNNKLFDEGYEQSKMIMEG